MRMKFADVANLQGAEEIAGEHFVGVSEKGEIGRGHAVPFPAVQHGLSLLMFPVQAKGSSTPLLPTPSKAMGL